MHRDYAPRGVKFYYIYKYLAHAGRQGVVQPFTLPERLQHIQSARQSLGTEIPWLCDTMDNDLKHALGDAPTSEFIIDPDGIIVRRRAWGNAQQLRKDLAELVGPIANPTEPQELDLKQELLAKAAPSGILKPIERPDNMKPLKVVPEIKPGGPPFYVKLRPEADLQLLSRGAGKLYLNFRMDPLYHVHWNNLAEPISIELVPAVGTTATPRDTEGPAVSEPADSDPREFLIDVQNWRSGDPIGLTVRYFACHDQEGWCRPVTQHYRLQLSEDVEDGYYVKPMAHGAAWPEFRGPLGNGHSPARNLPLTWSPTQNVSWRTALPAPGNSSPVVTGDRVIVSCAEDQGRRRSLYCFDRQSGRQLWVRTVAFDRVMPTHKTNPYCASTPLIAGQRIVVWHGSAGVFCYDLTGQQLWSRDLGEFRHMWGYGSSPIFHQDRVIINCGPGRRTFLIALDITDGSTRWQTDEPIEGDGDRNAAGKYSGSWSTPVVAHVDGKAQIICCMPTCVHGYDPQSGEVLWTCDGVRGEKGDLSYSTPLIADNMCVVISGFNGPAFGFEYGGTGNITDQARRWRFEPGPQNIGSGVLVGKHIYVPDAGPGTLRCIEPGTGKVVWQQRLPRPVWGSIVCADDRAYVTCQNGNTVVFEPNPNAYTELAVNPLGEPSNATPALAEGQIFLRTDQALYCIQHGQ